MSVKNEAATPDTSGEIKLTNAALQGIIAEACRSAVQGALASLKEMPSPKAKTEEELFQELVAKESVARPVKPAKRIPCRTDEGCTFTAVVQPFADFKNGKVVDLEEYRYPEWVDKIGMIADEHGPKGMRVREKDGALTLQFKHWLWVQYRQSDLKYFVGRDASKLPVLPAASDKAAE